MHVWFQLRLEPLWFPGYWYWWGKLQLLPRKSNSTHENEGCAHIIHSKKCWVILSTQPLGYEMFYPLWVIYMEVGLFCATHVLSQNPSTQHYIVWPSTWVVCASNVIISSPESTHRALVTAENLTDHPARQTNNKRYVYTTCLIHIVCVALPIKLLSVYCRCRG